MWQSGTAPPAGHLGVGGGVTDGLTEAQGLYQLECLAPGDLRAGMVSLLGPSSRSGKQAWSSFGM